MPQFLERTGQALRHGVERKQQQSAIGEVLKSGPARKEGIHQRQHNGTQCRSNDRRTAKQHDQQQKDRQVEGDEVGVDVLVLLRHEGASDAASDRTDDKGKHLHAVHIDTHAFGRHLGRLYCLQGAAVLATQQGAQHQVSRQRKRQNQPGPFPNAQGTPCKCRRNHAVNTGLPPKRNLPFGHDFFNHDAKANRDHCQRWPFHTQRGQRNKHTEKGRNERRCKHGQPGIPSVLCRQQSHGVGTSGKQSGVAKRLLPTPANQNIQAGSCKVVHACRKDDLQIELVADPPGHHQGQTQGYHEADGAMAHESDLLERLLAEQAFGLDHEHQDDQSKHRNLTHFRAPQTDQRLDHTEHEAPGNATSRIGQAANNGG